MTRPTMRLPVIQSSYGRNRQVRRRRPQSHADTRTANAGRERLLKDLVVGDERSIRWHRRGLPEGHHRVDGGGLDPGGITSSRHERADCDHHAAQPQPLDPVHEPRTLAASGVANYAARDQPLSHQCRQQRLATSPLMRLGRYFARGLRHLTGGAVVTGRFPGGSSRDCHPASKGASGRPVGVVSSPPAGRLASMPPFGLRVGGRRRVRSWLGPSGACRRTEGTAAAARRHERSPRCLDESASCVPCWPPPPPPSSSGCRPWSRLASASTGSTEEAPRCSHAHV